MIDTNALSPEQKSLLKLTFIGGGNMASAILDGCLSKGFNPKLCHVVEMDKNKCSWLQNQYGVNVFTDLSEMKETLHQQDMIILAVKPQSVEDVTKALASYLHDASNNQPLVISIAAGTRLESLQQWLGNYNNIIRTMPNMGALIHAGMTGLTALSSVDLKNRNMAETLMSAVGNILWFKDEGQLDTVTAVSGSGPAYVFYFIEALQEAAESLGLTAEQARLLALTTFSGASRLAAYSTDSVSVLREKVTSKGGTTEAALNHLNAMNVKQNIIDAIKTAEKRAKELGSSTTCG